MTDNPTPVGAQLQPLLHDGTVTLHAPTQAWSRADGDMGAAPIDGVYHGDTRFVSSAVLTVDGHSPESISTARPTVSRTVFTGLLRGIDDAGADPKVRITRERVVADGELREQITISSRVAHEIQAELTVAVAFDFATMHRVKAGLPSDADIVAVPTADGAMFTAGLADTGSALRAELAAGGSVAVVGASALLTWPIRLAPGATGEYSWTVRMTDPSMVVRAAASGWPAALPETADAGQTAARWVREAVGELDALRLALPDHPADEFFAAGSPWFFTLFGRDSLWAARLTLPLDPRIAASTLRVLARLQGTRGDDRTAEAPGKILHELRSTTFEVPGEGMSLPPVYYGTVDATPLWACLLADARTAGMPETEVRELLPALRGCLDWILSHGGAFLSYVDRSGHGLANQGWKDSGDSIQWRSGALADGPISLCEVQGYAYEAALAGAAILDDLGEAGGAELRVWAEALRTRFRAQFWVETPEGRYPAIALDAHGAAVDTLTSNIGHLLGTGILDPAEEAAIARLLTGPSMLSGYGIRTMSSNAGGYWPLSYHGGSVWTHDTAIIARGMARAGLDAEARLVVDDLLRVAEGFDFHVPELHAGDSAATTSKPIPYPAACRPQAWSAAAAITALEILRG